MSEDLNKHLESQLEEDEVRQPTELESLKARADMMGVKYHPSISIEKLRERVEASINGKPLPEDEDASEASSLASKSEASGAMTQAEKNAKITADATRLIRVNITCMNPHKREYEGEIIAAGNSVIGTIKKFIPFNTPDGYHVPKILLDVLKSKKVQIFVSVKRNGSTVRESRLINEYAIAELDPLTPEELRELARRQAMAAGQEES